MTAEEAEARDRVAAQLAKARKHALMGENGVSEIDDVTPPHLRQN